MQISRYEKLCHWLVFVCFMGLCTTALAADFFFSKEAILESFKNSLPIINTEIAPADQLFIARLERRETWDIHLYFGIALCILCFIWILINIFRKNKRHIELKVAFTLLISTLGVSGIWMWQRLYFDVSDIMFKTLKQIHHYGYWAMIGLIALHIIVAIVKENTNSERGLISNMFRFKNSIVFVVVSFLCIQNVAKADGELNEWANDKNYIEGVLFLEGNKGYETITKEITNCPYDKCKAADVNKTEFGTKILEIRKPDIKKAIELLNISSGNGNALATNKLLQFLIKRIDYKSQNPDEYLLNQLKEDTGLAHKEFKIVINKLINDGISTNKSCVAEYYFAEVSEYGYLDNTKDLKASQEHYKKASNICPDKNLFKMLAATKIQKM